MTDSPEEVSLPPALCGGDHTDQAALNHLLPLVYDELHRLASGYMRRERADHTLQTTALVNEAYLRLARQSHPRWQSRAHFFAVASKAMRHILIDYARAHARTKRGGGQTRLSLDHVVNLSHERIEDLLALHEALNRLSEIDERKAQVVEMRFFGGMTNDEVAESLKVHPNTVMRDWELSKAWLYRAMKEGAG